jgi:hypothetical protein
MPKEKGSYLKLSQDESDFAISKDFKAIISNIFRNKYS